MSDVDLCVVMDDILARFDCLCRHWLSGSDRMSCGLSCLRPLYRVNPFTLDQYIEIWRRGRVDHVYAFVVATTSIADRSWVNCDVVGSCREKLWFAWVVLVRKDL